MADASKSSESNSNRPSKDVWQRLAGQLATFTLDNASATPATVQRAVALARGLQERAAALQAPEERRQQAELDRMIRHPSDKATLVQLTDQAFRSHQPERAVDQLIHILDVQGIPRFFSRTDRALLKGFQTFGSYLPGVAAPLVEEKLHRETANVVLPAEPEMLTEHLQARQQAGVRMNVNFLGEGVLGESEAQRRLNRYLEALQLPEIEVVSVKISTIYSQISGLAFKHAVAVLCDRLELLYRAAARQRFTRHDGHEVPKFVYLDMEEYRDMEITAAAFMQTLDRPGLEQVSAGIALQAYLPDAFAVQQRLNAWARQRVALGSAPVTIRIVKGANMEMERVDASLAAWPQAPFREKLDTDANYKRMLHEGLLPENLTAVRLGIASHNLFDLAYGIVLAVEQRALDRVQLEMLEGMANHQRRALFELVENLLLYAPACRSEDLIHSVGYLIRRLDENTGPDNFLSHAFRLEVDSPEWKQLEQSFVESFTRCETLPTSPRRTQDRRQPVVEPTTATDWRTFSNEPDTDFSLPANRDWVQTAIEPWRDRVCDVPTVVAEEEIFEGREVQTCFDPSRPETPIGRFALANDEDVRRAVERARQDQDGWRAMAPEDRRATLRNVAQQLRAARGTLIGVALADGGKTILESDPEVSEAIDFVEFYSLSALEFQTANGPTGRGKGVVTVVSPWNFPIAIPCGGVAAALAAGNTVILKPASDTVLVAYELCQCFWRAGVSKNTLQFLPCRGSEQGQRLVTHPDVDVVILTGGTETALNLLAADPQMRLLAETGGKNATIVTALADRDQAIKHVLHSAFSHSGQKCSATSLLILESEVYDDPDFKRTLLDAASSLEVGSAWDFKNRLGPMIRPPRGVLERGLKELEPGESWAFMPRRLENNPQLYSPGIKWDVSPDSFTHQTELFGPVLGVMRAKNLEQAITLVNATGYGLTSGLESLDDREQQQWTESVRAGNLYMNRPTTGAIVLRQPFGGMGKSAFGPGIKAGGPNYVAQLMDFDRQGEPEAEIKEPEAHDPQLALIDQAMASADEWANRWPIELRNQVRAAIASYGHWMQEEFDQQHDHFRLIGQDNNRRYLAVPMVRVRIHPDDNLFDTFARVCAARAAGARVTVSRQPGSPTAEVAWLDRLTEPWAAAIEFLAETDVELAQAIAAGQTDRVRYAHPDRVPDEVRQAVVATGQYVADSPVLANGRVELLWYLQEQSLSVDYHRYGNLGARAEELRSDTL